MNPGLRSELQLIIEQEGWPDLLTELARLARQQHRTDIAGTLHLLADLETVGDTRLSLTQHAKTLLAGLEELNG